MLLRLLAAFIVVPLVELYLLFQLAEATNPLTTIAIIVLTGIIGSVLARREGVVAWYRFRSALAEGRVPSREIQDGLMIVFAAALLLTPGLLTDVVGFLLLVPAGRRLVRRFVLRRFFGRFNLQVVRPGRWNDPRSSGGSSYRPRDGYTIDAEVVHRHSEGPSAN